MHLCAVVSATRSLRRAFVLWLLLASAAGADTLQIIELRHRPAAEIEPVLRPLLRPDEAVSSIGYQLVVRASDARRVEIERLVATLDVAPRPLTLTLRQTIVRAGDSRRDSVSGEIPVGSRGRVVVPSNPDARGDDFTIERDGIRYRGERRSATTDESRVQTLRLQEGKPAFVRVGQSAPAVERIVALTGRGAVVVAQGIDIRQFSTGFDVLARIRGERVQLDITPRLAGGLDASGALRFQELQTSVGARLGEWVDLGGVLGQSSDVGRAILDSAATASNEDVRISLKVE